jgi:hypothetical protein
MNAINMPGFTAEHALYRGNRQSYVRASDTTYAFAPEIVPQGCIVLDGQLVCDFPRIPTDPRGPAHCRFRCYHTYHGAALQACLAEC